MKCGTLFWAMKADLRISTPKLPQTSKLFIQNIAVLRRVKSFDAIRVTGGPPRLSMYMASGIIAYDLYGIHCLWSYMNRELMDKLVKCSSCTAVIKNLGPLSPFLPLCNPSIKGSIMQELWSEPNQTTEPDIGEAIIDEKGVHFFPHCKRLNLDFSVNRNLWQSWGPKNNWVFIHLYFKYSPLVN